ncbi:MULTISPECIES: tetratricopeptide repeat protein [Treponema]|uniref:Tetratricopeptide repeat protein n=1 Tax=Treponema peruense TaxID=2787628 RepID=A0A7T3RBU1_9SPIR|nr:tetratricopeptide repeat protein [Treponema peruense]QQA00185.1 tetratricopeptide repeat protein [Treponema peruense]
MNSLVTVIITGILVAFIVFMLVFVLRKVNAPSKVDSIQKLLKEGKIQAAQRVAKSIISRDPRNYLAHYWLGRSYLADRKQELAFMEYKTVNQNALFNGEIPELEFRKQMAELYSKFNQPQEALKEYLLLTKLEPQNAENDYNVGKIYESQGNTGLAMGFYQKAIAVDKKNAKAYSAVGYLLYRSKQYTEAKKSIEYAIKLSPETYSNYYYLGKILKEMQELPAAIKAFERSLRSPEFKQKSMIERGACYMMAGQNDQATIEFENAVKNSKNPSSQETLYARYFLAACHEKSRRIEKAIEQWEQVYQVNPKFKDVASKLSMYKDLESNDGMKEYLTASNQKFAEICKTAAAVGFNLQCQKLDITPFGCSILATENKKDNWMNVRQKIFLLQFYRDTEPLEDTVVRKVVDTVKTQNYVKGIICTSSEFTRTAVSYAENRSVVLVTKKQLEAIFKKAGM